VLLPHLAGLRVERVLAKGRSVWVEAHAVASESACPDCGDWSARVHSRYQRRLSDVAAGGREMVVCLWARRFFCGNDGCGRRTFAEQFPGVTVPHGRRTSLLGQALEAIALAVGGRPGARLAARLAMAVSRMTLLRLVRALPVPEPGTLPAVGVDDFAFRRGATYGSIIVNMDTHRPVDLLPDRLSDTFADWLRAHPGALVICRDRASGFAEGARLGAPQAIQVADRWHLLKNLTDAVDKAVRAHRTCLRERSESDAVAQPPPVLPAVSTPTTEGRRAQLTRQRHAEVHALRDKGVGTTAICKALSLDHKTVLRYARVATADELLTEVAKRGSDLDEHTAYLARRWEEGCVNARRLHHEVRERGYRGSERSVRRLLQGWRASATPPSQIPAAAPTPREVVGWIIRPAADRDEQQRADLAKILDRCPTLRTVDQLVSDFAGMLRQRQGQHLDSWVAAAQTSDIPQLRGFADGLLKDYDAVRNGLTLEWSSGAVEGAVCRLKAIKRRCYGRANFDLLRRLVLLS
jgi:transposase